MLPPVAGATGFGIPSVSYASAGGRAMHKRRRSGAVLPAVYLGIACIVAVLVMPSVLRPPPEQQQSSGALTPNAPPDDKPETILQSLRQAASHTAGASGSQQQAVAATTTTTVVKPS